MRVIVAGSRHITDKELVFGAIARSGFCVSEIISGGARGVDTLGEQYARQWSIPVRIFAPSWDTHGKAAGVIRNVEMAAYGEALVLVWDGESKGSFHMRATAKKYGLKVYEEVVSWDSSTG